MAKELTREQISDLIRELIKAEGGQGKAATKIGVSSTYLAELLKGTREPGPTILEFFGLEKEVSYRKR